MKVLSREQFPFYVLGALLLLALAVALLPLPAVLLFGGTIVLGAALLLFPEIAIYLLVFAVPFGSLAPFSVGGMTITAADGLIVLAWALYLIRGAARRSIRLTVPPLALPFVVFILAAGVSLTVARSLPDGIAELAKWIELLAVYWLVAQEFGEAQVERTLAALFIAGLAEAAVGAYQYYFRAGPEGFLLFGGANLRAFGTFEQPNPYAGYLGLVLPLALGVALGVVVDARRALGASPRRLVLFVLAVLALGAMLAALFFSYSRGAWLGVAAALAVTVLIRSKRAALVGLVLAALAVGAALLGQLQIIPDVIGERFAVVGDYFSFEDVRGVRANDANFAIVERRAHWQAALGMFEDSPWLGVGLGNYAAAYPAYSLPKWDDPLGHAHNYYLNVLAEAGLVGFLAYLALWVAVIWQMWRAVRSLQGFAQGVAAGAIGTIVALSIHNLFDNLFVHALYIQVGIVLGLVQALYARRAGVNSSLS